MEILKSSGFHPNKHLNITKTHLHNETHHNFSSFHTPGRLMNMLLPVLLLLAASCTVPVAGSGAKGRELPGANSFLRTGQTLPTGRQGADMPRRCLRATSSSSAEFLEEVVWHGKSRGDERARKTLHAVDWCMLTLLIPSSPFFFSPFDVCDIAPRRLLLEWPWVLPER